MTTTTLGETIARNIAHHLERLDWEYDDLAERSGVSWGTLVAYRGDAGDVTLNELGEIATAFGVTAADLCMSPLPSWVASDVDGTVSGMTTMTKPAQPSVPAQDVPAPGGPKPRVTHYLDGDDRRLCSPEQSPPHKIWRGTVLDVEARGRVMCPRCIGVELELALLGIRP